MHTRVSRQFGVEGRGHHASLSHQDRIVIALRQNFNPFTDAFNARRANEDHLQRIAAQRAGSLDNAGVDLAPIRVAADCDIDRIETRLIRILHLFGQHDRARASAEGRLAVHELVKLSEASLVEQLEEGGGLAAGDHQAVNFVELLGLAHQYNFRAEFFQSAAMCIEITLQCEDADVHENALRCSLFALRQKDTRSTLVRCYPLNQTAQRMPPLRPIMKRKAKGEGRTAAFPSLFALRQRRCRNWPGPPHSSEGLQKSRYHLANASQVF